MPGIGQTAERGFDVVPATFILEPALDQLRDKGAPSPCAGTPVQLGYQSVIQCDMYAHGPKLAHTTAHYDGSCETDAMTYRFTPPDGRDSQTLHQVLARRVERHADAPWIAGEGRSWTYRDIDAMSGRIANGLAVRGIGKGETVLVMLPDCVEFIATWCGLAKLGAVQVPVNTHLRGNVLSHVIGDSRARTMRAGAQRMGECACARHGHVDARRRPQGEPR